MSRFNSSGGPYSPVFSCKVRNFLPTCVIYNCLHSSIIEVEALTCTFYLYNRCSECLYCKVRLRVTLFEYARAKSPSPSPFTSRYREFLRLHQCNLPMSLEAAVRQHPIHPCGNMPSGSHHRPSAVWSCRQPSDQTRGSKARHHPSRSCHPWRYMGQDPQGGLQRQVLRPNQQQKRLRQSSLCQ